MRSLVSVLLLCAVALCGCAGRKGPAAQAGASPRTGSGPVWAPLTSTNAAPTVAPDLASAGKVVLVNAAARHVVLNFPLGRMPAPDQRLSLYRRGVKVGEVKTSTWQREDNIIADLVAGEAEVGDETRGQ